LLVGLCLLERGLERLDHLSDLCPVDADPRLDVPFLLDAETLERGLNYTFTTSLGPLDVIGLPAGIRHFDELATNSATFDLGDGVHVQVCDLDDLIRMKRASGRAKDRIELEVLAAVRDERDRKQDQGGGSL